MANDKNHAVQFINKFVGLLRGKGITQIKY